MDNNLEHTSPERVAQVSEELAPHARNSGLYLRYRCVGEETYDAICGRVQKHSVGDGQHDSDARNLAEAHKGSGVGNAVGRELGLHDGDGPLREEACAESQKDAVTVDGRCVGVNLDQSVHERGADDHQDAAAEGPRHEVAVFAQHGAVQDAAEDHEEDHRQEPDACVEGGVVLDELEVELRGVSERQKTTIQELPTGMK